MAEPRTIVDLHDSAGLNPGPAGSSTRDLLLLFLASYLALYFELVIIRSLSTEIRIFAYLKNLPLIASFFGIGIGMVLGAPPRLLQRVFPALAFFLFFPIVFAGPLHLTHISFPNADYQVYGVGWDKTLPMFAAMLQFLGITLGFLCMIVAFFTVLGGMVGERLAHHPPLVSYGVNLLGSLGGIVVFTLFSFY